MIERGELWWADLGERTGSAPALRRPVLVVSADVYNGSRIATVVCLAVTSNLRLANGPGNVRLHTGDSGLTYDSVVNVTQVITLDKGDLLDRIGSVDGASIDPVEDGLRRVLGL